MAWIKDPSPRAHMGPGISKHYASQMQSCNLYPSMSAGDVGRGGQTAPLIHFLDRDVIVDLVMR